MGSVGFYVGLILTGNVEPGALTYPQGAGNQKAPRFAKCSWGATAAPAARSSEARMSVGELLAFAGHFEIHAAILVDLGGRRDVQVRERNFLRALRRETEQRVAHDGVVLDFFLVLIAEDQRGGRRGSGEFGVPRLVTSRSRVRVLISTAIV